MDSIEETPITDTSATYMTDEQFNPIDVSSIQHLP